ncbi:hypothetical protein [Shewanella waksmanii]|uniref:hypothetical protein n=1 Tax=Shewanella waksmanii TaxID=213783 RepID=UPI00048DA80F|nr:hypothetical protein [Shewanella waksmanii]
MHFKSLLCLTGTDSQFRFMAINALAYVVLLITTSFIGAHIGTLVVALPVIALVVLSAKRRVKHVAHPAWFILLPALPLLLFWSALAFDASMGFVVVSALLGVAVSLLTQVVLPATKSVKFDQFGYAGPHNHSTPSGSSTERRRVEPTLDGEVTEVTEVNFEASEANADSLDSLKEAEAAQINWQALAGRWSALSAVKQKMLMISSAALVVLVVVLSLLKPSEQVETLASEPVEPQSIEPVAFQADAKADMPDGFSVILFDGAVLLEWLGERGAPQQLWSLATAKGDRTCQAMEFNNGASYRPINVELLPSSATQARFSPLDTQAIITDIAMRGNLKLCGYQFSLKGSQAALAKSAGFIDYL